MPARCRGWRGDTACAAIVLSVCAATAYVWPPDTLLLSGFESRAFTSAGWRGTTASDHDGRSLMLRSLLRDHYPVGLTRREARNLLGQPDWAYGPHVGYGVGFDVLGVDPNDLVLVFGSDGRVASWFLLQH